MDRLTLIGFVDNKKNIDYYQPYCFRKVKTETFNNSFYKGYQTTSLLKETKKKHLVQVQFLHIMFMFGTSDS